jgi:hypothetical protein
MRLLWLFAVGTLFCSGRRDLGRHVCSFHGNGSNFGVREARGHGFCKTVLYDSGKMMLCFELLFVG